MEMGKQLLIAERVRLHSMQKELEGKAQSFDGIPYGTGFFQRQGISVMNIKKRAGNIINIKKMIIRIMPIGGLKGQNHIAQGIALGKNKAFIPAQKWQKHWLSDLCG